jgi:SAM-dependent methyltransferase
MTVGMKMTAKTESERFQSDAEKYAAYLETPEGRLRTDLLLPICRILLACGQATPKNRVCAGYRVRHRSDGGLFGASWHARYAAGFVCGDAGYSETDRQRKQGYGQSRAATWGCFAVDDLFPAASFDVVLCHNVLEYLDDPIAVLCAAARALRDSSAILSVLVRNRAGEVLKAAIKAGDLAAAENNLTAEWGQESLYGGGFDYSRQTACKPC